jgi:HEAT repeat protein
LSALRARTALIGGEPHPIVLAEIVAAITTIERSTSDSRKMLGTTYYGQEGATGGPRLLDSAPRRITDIMTDTRLRVKEAVKKAIADKSIEHICQLLIVTDRLQRQAAVETIISQADVIVADILALGLKHHEAVVRRTTADALLRLGSPEAVNALFLSISHGNVHYCSVSIDALTRIRTEDSARALISKLTSYNVHIRLLVIAAVGNPPLPDAVEPLISLLSDEDQNVRAEVLTTLGRIRDPRAAEPIVQLLTSGRINPIRPAIETLGILGNSYAVPVLCSILKTDSDADRAAACEALARIADHGSIDALCKALRDPSVLVRDRSVEALRRIDSVDSLPALKARLALIGGETNWTIRAAIVSAVRSISPPDSPTSKLPRAILPARPRSDRRPRGDNATPDIASRPREIEAPKLGMDD